MRIATSALLAAIGAALFEWAASGRRSTLGETVTEALTIVVPGAAGEQQ